MADPGTESMNGSTQFLFLNLIMIATDGSSARQKRAEVSHRYSQIYFLNRKTSAHSLTSTHQFIWSCFLAPMLVCTSVVQLASDSSQPHYFAFWSSNVYFIIGLSYVFVLFLQIWGEELHQSILTLHHLDEK
jgi:hypothetical protein